MSPGYLETKQHRDVRRGRKAVARMARSAPRQAALERLIWRDRVVEVLAEAEPADLAMACLLVEGLSRRDTAERLGVSRKAVYRRLERWRRRVGEGQPELAAWLGKAST